MPLPGKKTIIVGICFGLVAAAEFMGLVTPELATALKSFLMGGGLIFLRSAIANKV